MSKRKGRILLQLKDVTVTKAGGEGVCIAHHEGKVIMIEKAVPGDVAHIREISSKKKYALAVIEELVKPSPDRVLPFCSHHALCGGCKWQQMSYEAQLSYKQQHVQDAYERIGKFPFPEILPILPSTDFTHYRNKVEFNFTEKKWLETLEMKDNLSYAEHAGLGYHVPGRYDKVFDVQTCWLMDDLHNVIRNDIREYCLKHGYTFYNLYSHTGLMRSLIFRNNLQGEWMLIVVFAYADAEKQEALLSYIKEKFPQIVSLNFVINSKQNDTIHDLPVESYSGMPYLIQTLENLHFKIGPKSFFQTNSKQTLRLYETARDMAQLSGHETVYDLYTGVGTIALFVAPQSTQVIGIEYIPEAIEDAKMNAAYNSMEHVHFYAGDMKDLFGDELIKKHGIPDVVITDPPRAGMHESVINRLLAVAPKRIVYVSCNPATQARDIALLQSLYEVTRVQPVDMFPHTHHVECVTLLEKKEQSA